ncbi:multidrug efflux pump subunit AcrB [Litorimonas taeanensis]|uniref:Multidrug efflux pump subunit AcrB n=1 Tax=Litorimonas taeanensis TaxID=568099 RepID=A0A420WDF2_9PROT|nr:efflux RND transporter permease subunit [Litorimonas taeanensis]RKQ69049.1 multidrug efflux pump subunit AcrB [Litorimonas taeanensis]
MKGLITWFVKNPVAANLIMIILFAAGAYGYFSMQREFIPQTTVNGMTISASWPGASPRDVEQQIVTRIEEAIDGLDGIDYIESTSREGSGNVNVRTKLTIDYEKMLDQVKSRVDSIQNLPPDAFRPQIFRWDARADIMYLALYGDTDRLTLQREATALRQKLTKLPGLQLTSQVTKVPEQVTIEISEEALRRYNLTFSQVATAISGSSVNLSAGTVETTGGNLQLRARSLANSAEEFEQIIVRQTSDGGTVRVRDIASVIDGFETDDFSARFRGKETAIFQVLSPDEMNITKSGDAIRQFEKDIRNSLPPNLDFAIHFDGSTMFDSRMNLIGSNALSGMILVLITLMLFLRPAVAVWVTVGIAAAFAGAIAIAPSIGITLNMISLFAFLLVIGIVVDDAIVVGESIHFHVENGVQGQRGAVAGAYMVAKPVFFAVITTIMMFIPFMLLTGPIRAITAQISLVVIAVLVFSLLEAFFILPAHLRHLKHEKSSNNRLLRFQNRLAESLVTFARVYFRPLVAFLMKWRYVTMATFVGLFIMSMTFLVKGVAPSAFLPEVEADMIVFNSSFPEGTNFERKLVVREQLDAGIAELNANVEKDFGIDWPLITKPATFTDNRGVEGYLGLSENRPDISTKMIADKLEEYVGPIPDAYRVDYGTTEGGSGNGGGLRYGVTSADAEALRVALLEIKDQMETYPDIPRAWDNMESSASEIRFTLKPGAETLGITLSEVTRQVREAFYGREVQRLPRNGEDVRVMVRYPEAARESIDSLQTLRIRAANGVEVPLFSVAEVSFTEGVGRINRRDRKQVNYTGGRVRGEQSRVAEIKRDMEENFFPQWELRNSRVSRVVVGDDQIQSTMQRELLISVVVILGLMYVLLAVAFKSYAQPFLIMVALPFALVGMIFGNMITGVPFGMFSIFGLFAAGGVAVNDNLVLIDYVNRLRAKGVGAYQAMLDACVARFRPILLTSVTTFIGITPILFETSSQAEFLKPMVVALAFGVLFDFFLTLMLVPAMYGIGVDITRLFRGLWTGVKQPGFGSSYDPDMALALEDMELDEDLQIGSGTHPSGTPPVTT